MDEPNALTPGSGVTLVQVDDDGLVLAGADEVILDVLFDGRRIWSFWLLRDSVAQGTARRIEWPSSLRRFLDGRARLGLLEHLSGAVVYDAETAFGAGEGQISIVNEDGKPLGIDKSGRMAQTFDTRSAEHVAPLLDSVQTVLAALAEAGVEAFPAYGTLLGAVREGRLIGHDSDADLGYVSRHQNPVDVIRESFTLQRRLAEMGYPITRYSGAAFKVDVEEGDGSIRGLDVFGGFLTHGRLYLMGEVGCDFEPEWIFPLGTCELEGRTLPAPARPDKLLEAMYGPGWKVPDPAFHFETPASTIRRLNGWFRGTRVFRDSWDRYYSTRRTTLPDLAPSPLAEYVVEREGGLPAEVIDVGAGRGADALWFARQGVPVVALDYLPTASTAVQHLAAEEGLDLQVRPLNLLELRSTLAEGALLASRPEPNRVLVANHLVDAVNGVALERLGRLASMALSGGGRLYASGYLPGGERQPLQRPVRLRGIESRLRAAGAVLVDTEEHNAPGGRRIGRWVAQWQG